MTTLRKFVKENREEITKIVKKQCPNCNTSLTELEGWVQNDEGLYQWAVEEGLQE